MKKGFVHALSTSFRCNFGQQPLALRNNYENLNMKKYTTFIHTAFFIALSLIFLSCSKDEVEEKETWSEISGLKSPMGMARDSKGRIWLTEAGTGANDASLSVISLSGQRTPVLSGLPSVVENGAVEGIGRPHIRNNTLFFSHGTAGLIYKLKSDAGALVEADFPLSKSDFEVWDINSFARALPTSGDANTNVVDLYLHDNGDLYILDAGANALIRRDRSSGAFSLFAEFPKIPTPAPFPASEDAVPTGLVFDGSRFLVSALSSAPFNPEKAKIFSVSTAGQTTEYKGGFTNLIHIELDPNNKPVVLQHALFSLQTGFQAGSGAILDEKGTVLVPGVNRPTDLLRKDDQNYYLLCYGDGTLKKVKL